MSASYEIVREERCLVAVESLLTYAPGHLAEIVDGLTETLSAASPWLGNGDKDLAMCMFESVYEVLEAVGKLRREVQGVVSAFAYEEGVRLRLVAVRAAKAALAAAEETAEGEK